MNDWSQRAYEALPHFLRQWTACVHGARLSRQRYGADADRRVRDALEREQWGRESWERWRMERLDAILSLASDRVAAYRGAAPPRRSAAEATLTGRLSDWPVLKKSRLRADPASFLADGRSPSSLICERTSGSTGTPLSLWYDRGVVREWYAMVEARWRNWYGLNRWDRWGIVGGRMVVPAKQQRPPYWVWNAPMRQLYLSAYHLSEKSVADYASAIKEHRLVYLWGYASALATLARFVLEQGIEVPQLRACISNAEPLSARQRERIGAAFRCRVVDTYGMSERVCAASECEFGVMHLWPETGVWEVLRDTCDEPAPEGETGRLVCTGLLNQVMPLIRYDTGDRVALHNPDFRCRCGRGLPALRCLDGRSDDMLVTPGGRWIGRLDPVFKNELAIAEAQIVQDETDHITVRIVRGFGYSERTEGVLKQSLLERLPDMRVTVEYHAGIPRSANGKFKAVIGLPRRDASVSKPNTVRA